MLKLAFLRKNTIEYTDTYYYAFYGAADHFDNLSSAEKKKIKEASGVDGYVETKGKAIKTGYREKGKRLLYQVSAGKLSGTAEDLYADFLMSIADGGLSKKFDENFNKEHERSGKKYDIESYMYTLIRNFVRKSKDTPATTTLSIGSVVGDRDPMEKNVVDVDRKEINNSFLNTGRVDEMDLVDEVVSFKDTLLVLKFFESYLQVSSILQYILLIEIKSLFKETGHSLKYTEKKGGTLPTYTYAEIGIAPVRSNVKGKIKDLDQSVVDIFIKTLSTLIAILNKEGLEISDLPANLLDSKYMHSLRNDSFSSIVDYIENRRETTPKVVKTENGVSITQIDLLGTRIELSVDILKKYNPKFTYGDVVDLINANQTKFKELYNKYTSSSKTEAEKLKLTREKLQGLMKSRDRIIENIKTGYDTQTKSYVSKGVKETLQYKLKDVEEEIQKIQDDYKRDYTLTNVNPYKKTYEKYIGFMQSYKTAFIANGKEIEFLCDVDTIEETELTPAAYKKAQGQYKLQQIIENQTVITTMDKILITNRLRSAIAATKATWVEIGDNWYATELSDSTTFSPMLMHPSGIIIKLLEKQVVPLYRLGIGHPSLPLDYGRFQEFYDAFEEIESSYRQFYTVNKENITNYLHGRRMQANNVPQLLAK